MDAAARAQAAYDPVASGPSLLSEVEALDKAAHYLHEQLDGLAESLGVLLAPETDGHDPVSPSIAAVEAPRAPVVSHLNDVRARVGIATEKVARLRSRLQVSPR
jgi:hypothetical protein